MVLIGGVKYACERCIRGHRVTTCNHTDQPLIMIKPKGRPSSQCKHCKNLRVTKNVHSSSACTCGQQTANGTKKKCCCEIGKTCDCHKKKSQLTKRNSINKSSDDIRKSGLSRSMSSSSSIHLASKEFSSKRAGEVVVPINEYVPTHPQHEIGPVFNEKAVNGIFQDVPLPFEPGHGLLDLFEPSQNTSSSNLNADQYRLRNQNNYYYSSYSNSNSSNNLKPKENKISENSTLSVNIPSSNSIKSYNSPNFDLFHNLGLSPTTEPQSMTPTHPVLQSKESSTKKQQNSGSLFGNYSNYHQSLDRESLTSRSEVEVCSVTPSFNDFKQNEYLQSDSHLNHVSSLTNVSSKFDSNDDENNDNIINNSKDINYGFLDNELNKFKNDNTEFPEMLEF